MLLCLILAFGGCEKERFYFDDGTWILLGDREKYRPMTLTFEGRTLYTSNVPDDMPPFSGQEDEWNYYISEDSTMHISQTYYVYDEDGGSTQVESYKLQTHFDDQRQLLTLTYDAPFGRDKSYAFERYNKK